nr:putative ribonuclease H-like domain-containing protein [Tanacetum cinerariifolium]
AIEKGAGPNWLSDIDSLTKSINYVPVDACTNSTNLSGTKDAASQEVKVANQVETPSLDNILTLINWFKDILRVTTNSIDSDGVEANDLEFPTKVYKVEKAMYGLHQAPRADCFEKKLISVDHIHTDENVADLLTKPFDAGRFQYLVVSIGMCKLFPLLGKHSTVSVFLCFGLTFAGTSKYWGVLRILMISHRLIPLVSKGDATMIASCKTCWSSSPLRHYVVNMCINFLHGLDSEQMTHEFIHVYLASASVPSFSGRIVPLFDTMLIPQGEGSGTPTEPHHTPSPEAQPTSSTTPSSPTLPSVTTAPIPTITLSDTPPLRKYTSRTKIAQSSVLPPAADEPAFPLRDVSKGEACPTDSGFGADQDRANIAKTSTLPYDSAPKVTSPAADEGTQEREIHRLKARVKLLEDKGVVAERFGDDAPIKGRNLDKGEVAAERASDDTEEMATVLTSMDATTILASGVAEVSTGSGSIPTVGPPATEVPT